MNCFWMVDNRWLNDDDIYFIEYNNIPGIHEIIHMRIDLENQKHSICKTLSIAITDTNF